MSDTPSTSSSTKYRRIIFTHTLNVLKHWITNATKYLGINAMPKTHTPKHVTHYYARRIRSTVFHPRTLPCHCKIIARKLTNLASSGAQLWGLRFCAPSAHLAKGRNKKMKVNQAQCSYTKPIRSGVNTTHSMGVRYKWGQVSSKIPTSSQPTLLSSAKRHASDTLCEHNRHQMQVWV